MREQKAVAIPGASVQALIEWACAMLDGTGRISLTAHGQHIETCQCTKSACIIRPLVNFGSTNGKQLLSYEMRGFISSMSVIPDKHTAET